MKKTSKWFAVCLKIYVGLGGEKKGIKSLKKGKRNWVWCHTSLIPALGRQTQADLYDFKGSLVYRVGSRTAKDTQRNPVSKSQKLKVKIKEMEVKTKPIKD